MFVNKIVVEICGYLFAIGIYKINGAKNDFQIFPIPNKNSRNLKTKNMSSLKFC